MPRGISLLFVASLALLAGGCGPLLDATVSGRVTVEGTPLTNGTVTFHPVDPRRNSEASGEIDSSGNFHLQTQELEGVLNGEYKVTVVGSNAQLSETGEVIKKPTVITPMHYGLVRQSPLRYRIRTGPNVVNLNLEVSDLRTKLPGTREGSE